MLILKSAGFESVRLEDRSFGAAATAGDKDHRRVPRERRRAGGPEPGWLAHSIS